MQYPEHSIEAFLCQKSTEELDRMLGYFLDHEDILERAEVIRFILKILEEREK